MLNLWTRTGEEAVNATSSIMGVGCDECKSTQLARMGHAWRLACTTLTHELIAGAMNMLAEGP